MSGTTTDAPRTGSVTLDSIAEEIRGIDKSIRETIETNRAAGDEAINKLILERQQDREELVKMGERIAQMDVDLKLSEKEKRSIHIGEIARACYIEHASKGNTRKKDVIPEQYDILVEAERHAKDQHERFRKITGIGGGESRDMGTIDDQLGGALIPVGPAREFLDLLRAKLVLATLGARFLTNLQGHRIPITVGLSQGSTAYWQGENDQATKSELKFDTKYMRPHRLSAFVPVANNLLRWSPMAVQQMIQDDMLAGMARKIQTAAIYGTGSEHQPSGLTTDTSIGTGIDLGTDGGRFKRRHVIKMRKNIMARDVMVNDETTGLLMSPSVWELLLTEGVEQWDGQGSDDGMPVHGVNLSEENLRALLGRFQVTSAVLETNTKGSGTDLADVIYGDWSQLLIGQWGGFRMRASDTTGNASGSALLMDQTWIVADVEVDSRTRRPQAFEHINHATTS